LVLHVNGQHPAVYPNVIGEQCKSIYSSGLLTHYGRNQEIKKFRTDEINHYTSTSRFHRENNEFTKNMMITLFILII